jgi:hypothetical protein
METIDRRASIADASFMGPVPVVRVFTSNQASGGNAMPTTVATYYQLRDDPINLSGAVGTILKFTQPITVTPAGGEGALVTWFAGAVFGGGNVTYTVTLNGTLLGSYEAFAVLAGTFRIPTQETIASNVLKHGSGAAGNNDLVFTKTGGVGTLTLSAVMLWHRVSV